MEGGEIRLLLVVVAVEGFDSRCRWRWNLVLVVVVVERSMTSYRPSEACGGLKVCFVGANRAGLSGGGQNLSSHELPLSL